MGEIYQKPSSPLIFGIQIEDGNSNLFPVAHAETSSGGELDGSPFTLTHQSDGWYQFRDSDLFYPQVCDVLRVTYIIYEDSAHTTESNIYMRDVDNIRLWDQENLNIEYQILQLMSLVRRSAEPCYIQGVVDSPESYIQGVVDSPDYIQGVVDSPEIVSTIDPDQSVVGVVENSYL